jgi:ABC-type transport system involved in cytochrome bd biosynthesis fused ATPase/permease subunit
VVVRCPSGVCAGLSANVSEGRDWTIWTKVRPYIDLLAHLLTHYLAQLTTLLLLLLTMETQLSNLEQRVEAVEKGQGLSHETEQALRAYQAQVVEKLIRVRDLLLHSDSADATQAIQERDEAREENKKLKKEIEKLNYRVTHLVRALEVEEKKN